MSLCEKDCEYKGYDSIKKRSLCECFVKIKFPLISEVLINRDKLLENFLDLKKNINLDVMKCYKTLFTPEGIKTNIGFYTILFIIVISVILTILFKYIGYKKLNNRIDEIIKIKKEKENIEINNNEIDNINDNSNKNEIKSKVYNKEFINVKYNANDNDFKKNSNIKKVKTKKMKIKKKIKIKKKYIKMRNLTDKVKDNSYNKLYLSNLKYSKDYNKIKNNNDYNNNVTLNNNDISDTIKINYYNYND